MPGFKASCIIVIYSLGFTLKNFLKSPHAWRPLLRFLLVGPGQSWGQPGFLGLFCRDGSCGCFVCFEVLGIKARASPILVRALHGVQYRSSRVQACLPLSLLCMWTHLQGKLTADRCAYLSYHSGTGRRHGSCCVALCLKHFCEDRRACQGCSAG